MERERVTISVKKEVLKKIDKFVDGTNVRNRSNAIEILTLKALGEESTKKAVVLLGGKDALRFIPATKDFLFKLKEVGFDHVHIAVGFLGDKIKEKLGNGSEFGMKFSYSDKGEGSSGALSSLKKHLTETFIIFNSEENPIVDLKFLIDYHKQHKAIATIATTDLTGMKGIYLFEPEIFSFIPRGFSMIEDDLIPLLVTEGKAIIYPVI
jgi:NDP-sugar pyrophosphorylase family protein